MNKSTNSYNRIPGLIVYDLNRPEERLMYALALAIPKQAISLK